jgi:hypothetical protein
LQEAWAKAQPEPGGELPSLPETLRTLGGQLDQSGARAAVVVIAEGQDHAEVFGESTLFSLSSLSVVETKQLAPEEVQQASAAQMALRGQVPPADAGLGEGYESLLRAVGEELERADIRDCQIVVTRQIVSVEGPNGYSRVFAARDLARGERTAGRRSQEQEQ